MKEGNLRKREKVPTLIAGSMFWYLFQLEEQRRTLLRRIAAYRQKTHEQVGLHKLNSFSLSTA
jgi:hypothetical protein